MKKILFVATIFGFVNSFLLDQIKMFKDEGYQVHVAAGTSYMGMIEIPNCDKQIELSIVRTPYSVSNIKAFKQLKEIIKKENYDIISCHTPMGGVLTRLAARKSNARIIYTAHGFHFFNGASKKNWLIYYPVEKLLARYTDTIITINQEDYKRAKKFNCKNIMYVPGVGVDTKKLSEAKNIRTKIEQEFGIPHEAKLLLNIGELSHRKNQKIIIEALAKLKNNNVYLLICGIGEYKEKLMDLSASLGVKNRVIFMGQRNDIPQICKSCDVFVFPSLQEGLPVALMEAMATGLPIVCSKIRGNVDLIEDEKGGILCDPNSSEQFRIAIEKVLNCDTNDMKRINTQTIKKIDKKIIDEEIRRIYLNG